MESNEVLKQGVGFKIAYQILITMFIVTLIPIGDLWYNSVYLSRQNWEATISQNQLTNERTETNSSDNSCRIHRSNGHHYL